jgi:hypothetical protein
MILLCEMVRLCVDVGLREASEFCFQFKVQFQISLRSALYVCSSEVIRASVLVNYFALVL